MSAAVLIQKPVHTCLKLSAASDIVHYDVCLSLSFCGLWSSGEVTPGLSQTEYELRRLRLASLIEAQSDSLGPSASSSTHVVIVLSHPTRYMTNDIPYPFHQYQVCVVQCLQLKRT